MESIKERSIKINFNTQHNQFYICDKNSPMATDGDFWSEIAFKRRLAKESGLLGIRTACYGPVKGEIDFMKTNPSVVDLSKFDHVVEGDIFINSGILQIKDCPNGAVEFEKNVTPGNYRVRIYSMNIASVKDDEGNDFYRIEVWKDKPQGEILLKEYE